MPGPIDSLLFVHEAILVESARTEERALALTPESARAWKDELAFFALLIDRHTRGEEKGLFPRLAEKEPHFADTYLHDHEGERARYRELVVLVGAVADGDEAAIPRTQRLALALSEATAHHIAKENALVLPLVHELFDPPTQGAMVGEILSVIAPEETARAVPWIVDRCSEESALAYVGVLSKAMPPPVFEKAKGWIREGCDGGRVAALEARSAAFA